MMRDKIKIHTFLSSTIGDENAKQKLLYDTQSNILTRIKAKGICRLLLPYPS